MIFRNSHLISAQTKAKASIVAKVSTVNRKSVSKSHNVK